MQRDLLIRQRILQAFDQLRTTNCECKVGEKPVNGISIATIIMRFSEKSSTKIVPTIRKQGSQSTSQDRLLHWIG